MLRVNSLQRIEGRPWHPKGASMWLPKMQLVPAFVQNSQPDVKWTQKPMIGVELKSLLKFVLRQDALTALVVIRHRRLPRLRHNGNLILCIVRPGVRCVGLELAGLRPDV